MDFFSWNTRRVGWIYRVHHNFFNTNYLFMTWVHQFWFPKCHDFFADLFSIFEPMRAGFHNQIERKNNLALLLFLNDLWNIGNLELVKSCREHTTIQFEIGFYKINIFIEIQEYLDFVWLFQWYSNNFSNYSYRFLKTNILFHLELLLF